MTISPNFPSSLSENEDWCDPKIQFRCSNGFCIRKWKMCDGVKHCVNGSDEHGCRKTHCRTDQFKCQDSKCIDKELICNGFFDCKGGEDELDCTRGLYCSMYSLHIFSLMFCSFSLVAV